MTTIAYNPAEKAFYVDTLASASSGEVLSNNTSKVTLVKIEVTPSTICEEPKTSSKLIAFAGDYLYCKKMINEYIKTGKMTWDDKAGSCELLMLDSDGVIHEAFTPFPEFIPLDDQTEVQFLGTGSSFARAIIEHGETDYFKMMESVKKLDVFTGGKIVKHIIND